MPPTLPERSASARTWPLAMLIAGAAITALALGLLQSASVGATQGVVAVAGVLTTAVAVLATSLLARARVRHERQTDALTAELGLLAQVARYTFNAVIVTGADRRTRWVNQGFTRVTGYSEAEALGRFPLDLLRSTRTDGSEVDRLHAALAARRGYRGEVLVRTRDGRELWADVEVQALSGPRGEPTGYIVILSDLTERQRAAEALARERSRLAHILEGTGAGDGEWNLVTGEVLLSPRWAAMFGWTLDELAPIGIERWLSFMHPDDLPAATAALQRHLRGQQEQFHHEVRMRHRDGRWLSIDLRGRVSSFTADGKPEWFSGTHIDVTEQRRVTEDLRTSLALIDALFEGIPIPVVMKDAQGRYARMNKAFAQLFGRDASEVLGKTARELIDGPAADRHDIEDGELLRKPGTRTYEVHQDLQGGGSVDSLVCKSTLLGQGGEVLGLVGTVVDISEQKATQRALAEAKEVAEAANRAKSAFLATMSHEIRTPMNGVLGMAELLAHSALDAEQAQTVHTIRESANALLRLIDDILDFSKIEAGRLELDVQPLLLTPLVEGVCEALLPLAVDKQVVLHQFVDPRTPESVLADEVRLRQLLNNLIGNAIKFSAGRPEVAGQVSLRVRPQDGGLRFEVSDNGIGMDDATLSRLFRPFTQAEASTTRRYGGTGLGLAICRRLVEMKGGRIDVQSQPGAGSTFCLWLPLPATPEQPPAPDSLLQGLDVVLVESAELPSDDLQVWLEAAGARVRRATDAAGGAQAARELRRPPVLIQAERPDGRSVLPEDSAIGLRHLLIARGRRGPPRQLGPGIVTLDLMRRVHFVQAVALAAGRAPGGAGPVRPAEALDGSPGAAPSVDAARREGCLILVAEDDPTNRTVIRRQLALLGYAAEVAEDGRQALALWHQGGHALLLTDLNMPGMDGQALARAIRAEEAEAARPRLPIIALTAHVLRGESVSAPGSPIDDHLTKPVPLRQLQAVLNRWLAPAAPAPAPAPPSGDGAAAAPAVLDLSVLHDLVGDDEETVRELLLDFLDSASTQAQDLVIALQAGDLRHVAAIAHKLKSAARSVGALTLGELCARLEQRADASDPRAARELLAQFEAQFSAAIAAIDAAMGAQPS